MLALILTTFAKSHSSQRGPGQVMNRLVVYQMQEEALKEKTDEKAAEHPRRVGQPEVVDRKSPVRKKRITQAKPRQQEKPLELPPFHRKPVWTTPSAHETLALLEPLKQSFSSFPVMREALSAKVIPIKPRNRARRRAAAFLLLAA